jgi:DNA polymerase III subunit epsilon
LTKLFFDTETSADKEQRLVQLAAILTDDDGKEIQSINFIVKPEEFVISQEATAIHGISQEQAEKYGVAREVALSAFIELACVSKKIIAHNITFDKKVICDELSRNFNKASILTEVFKDTFCTMNASTNICAIPHKSRRGYKWPRLQEAHYYAFGEEFDGAHNALNDVRACMRLYFWLKTAKPGETK